MRTDSGGDQPPHGFQLPTGAAYLHNLIIGGTLLRSSPFIFTAEDRQASFMAKRQSCVSRALDEKPVLRSAG